MGKSSGESGPRNGTGVLIKEQNNNFAETIHQQQDDCQIFPNDGIISVNVVA